MGVHEERMEAQRGRNMMVAPCDETLRVRALEAKMRQVKPDKLSGYVANLKYQKWKRQREQLIAGLKAKVRVVVDNSFAYDDET